MFAETEFDRSLVEMLESTALPGRPAAKNAVRHIDKAYALAELDPDMAAFRAITAEEEAATGLFHSLKRHSYPGSEALKPRDHLQKSAVAPFCSAVARLFALADQEFDLRSQLAIVGDNDTRRLETQFHVSGLGLGNRIASPQPPLNLAIQRNDGLHDFGEQLQALAEDRNCASILEHLRRRANMRNEILYASAAGLPNVALGDFIEKQRSIVKGGIVLFLLIDPYYEHQLLVSQALRAFLRMLNRLPPDLEF
jgi:hypothetical protein